MKFSTLYLTSLSLLPSFIAAVAIPDVASRNETLVKRGGEVNYLANCQRSDGKSSYTASYAAWYSNVDFSQSGHDSPNSLSNEYRNWGAGGDYLHWEGQPQDLYFKESAATLSTHIDSDAGTRQFTAYAGWAQRNTDGKKFNCYKAGKIIPENAVASAIGSTGDAVASGNDTGSATTTTKAAATTTTKAGTTTKAATTTKASVAAASTTSAKSCKVATKKKNSTKANKRHAKKRLLSNH